MPADPARAAIAVGAETLGLSLQTAQLDRLAAFLALLERWNRTYNLTSIRDPHGMVVQHVFDCLAVVAPLRRQLEAMARRRGQAGAGESGGRSTAPAEGSAAIDAADAAEVRLLDVGSGGGLPGVVLAIALPRLQVTCIDAVGKKAAFVQQVAGALTLTNLYAAHGRVEQLPRGPGGMFELITARAYAALPDFVRSTRHLLAPGGCWMAMKGHDPVDERNALPPDVAVFHVEQLQVQGLDAKRCLVWMRPSVERDSS